MPRPSTSGYAAAAVASAATLVLGFTAFVDQNIWFLIAGTVNNGNNAVGDETATWNGTAMNLVGRCGAAAGGFVSGWLFSLPREDVVPGAGVLQFNGSDVGDYSAMAFNDADGPSDARPILFGTYYKDQWGGNPKTFTRYAYGWDALGRQVAFLYGGNGATVTLTGGTNVASGSGTQLNVAECADTEIAFTASRASGDRLYLLSFMIPPGEDEQPRTGGGHQVWFGGWCDIASLLVGETQTGGLPWGGASSGPDPTGGPIAGNMMLAPGTMHSWAIKSPVAPGVGNTVTAELIRGGTSGSVDGIGRNDGIPTGITQTLSGASQKTNSRSVDLSWARYERCSVRYTFTAGTSLAAGTRMQSTFLAESGEASAQAYGGGAKMLGSAVVDTAFRRAPLHPDNGTIWSNFPSSEKSLTRISCTVREMVVDHQVDVASDPYKQFYLERYPAATPLVPVLQDGAGGSIDTEATLVANSLGPALARSRFVLPLDPYDLLACVGYLRTAQVAAERQAVSIKLVPVTPGEQMMSGHSVAVTGTGNYVAFPVSPRSETTTTTGDEAKFSSVLPPMTAAGDDFHVLGFSRYLEPTGPGAGSETTKLRKNQADTSMPSLAITGSAGAPVTGETEGDVAFTGGDELSYFNTVASSPVLARQFWAIPGFIAPPGDDDDDDDDEEPPPPGDSGLGVCITAPVLGACYVDGGPPSAETLATTPETTRAGVLDDEFSAPTDHVVEPLISPDEQP